LQSVYSRRWKNTAVYGASQAQTTICSILFAITGVIPQALDFCCGKRLSVSRGAVCSQDLRKTGTSRANLYPLSHAQSSPSKASPGEPHEQGAEMVHFMDSLLCKCGQLGTDPWNLLKMVPYPQSDIQAQTRFACANWGGGKPRTRGRLDSHRLSRLIRWAGDIISSKFAWLEAGRRAAPHRHARPLRNPRAP